MPLERSLNASPSPLNNPRSSLLLLWCTWALLHHTDPFSLLWLISKNYLWEIFSFIIFPSLSRWSFPSPNIWSWHLTRSVASLFQSWNSDFKNCLPKSYLCFWLLSFQRLFGGNRQWEKQISSTYRRFSLIKHRHKMSSVTKQNSQTLHRLPKPSQGFL